ncbi:MAG: ribosome small subunit-dependent GTPase A [Bacteroidetes bacterium]|nr:ribosome small subunit-dependent GTPase A [Bacteroidota bacterium]MCW5894975.1 ribosome small subunit-dependent GTPase A [Bacteroidota bacterium]
MNSPGYTDTIAAHARQFLEQGFSIARVIEENRESYIVKTSTHEMPAEISGKLRFTAESRENFPAVGDWVAVNTFDDETQAIIHAVLPRETLIARKSASQRTEIQLIAANVDIIFIVQGLDHNFNSRRLERYLVVAHESGATPVILLSKADLLSPQELQSCKKEASDVSAGAEVIAYSAETGEGLDAIKRHITEGVTTICLVGSSGVGKSTLINTLSGENLLETGSVREDDSRGRHTTARRQMVFLPGGGILIDTPGMRELGLWHAESSLDQTFPEIADLAEGCKFSDCTHRHEPECAVRAAAEQGALDPDRFAGYLKLRKEADRMNERTTVAGMLERKRKDKILSKAVKQVMKMKQKK